MEVLPSHPTSPMFVSMLVLTTMVTTAISRLIIRILFITHRHFRPVPLIFYAPISIPLQSIAGIPLILFCVRIVSLPVFLSGNSPDWEHTPFILCLFSLWNSSWLRLKLRMAATLSFPIDVISILITMETTFISRTLWSRLQVFQQHPLKIRTRTRIFARLLPVRRNVVTRVPTAPCTPPQTPRPGGPNLLWILHCMTHASLPPVVRRHVSEGRKFIRDTEEP